MFSVPFILFFIGYAAILAGRRTLAVTFWVLGLVSMAMLFLTIVGRPVQIAL